MNDAKPKYNSEIEYLSELIDVALTPEDIFGRGVNGSATLEDLRSVYHQLAKKVHPDIFATSANKTIAEKTFKKLNTLWAEAQLRLEQNVYGTNQNVIVKDTVEEIFQLKSRKFSYTSIGRSAIGKTCGVFKGVVAAQNVSLPCIMKIPHSAADNDLMEVEANMYRKMQSHLKTLKLAGHEDISITLSKRIPTFLESIKLQCDDGQMKIVNTFLITDELGTNGWYTLEQIREKYPQGVNERIAIFIFNRMIEGLMLAHDSQILHRHLTPNHVIIHAETHTGNILDWSCATQRFPRNFPFLYQDTKYSSFFPKEYSERRQGFAHCDLYMAASNVVYVLGGDNTTRSVPETVSEPFLALLNKCLQPKGFNRFHNAGVLREELKTVAQKLYGPPTFVKFEMQ